MARRSIIEEARLNLGNWSEPWHLWAVVATGVALFLLCFFLIRRRMRKRGTGFFFYLEYVWLPVVILLAAALAWSQVDSAPARS